MQKASMVSQMKKPTLTATWQKSRIKYASRGLRKAMTEAGLVKDVEAVDLRGKRRLSETKSLVRMDGVTQMLQVKGLSYRCG